MAPRVWTATGWFLILVTVTLVIVACGWDWNSANQHSGCPSGGVIPDGGVGAGSCVPPVPGYVGALVCVVFAAVALSSAVACFFWGAHRRALADLAALLDETGGRP